MKKNYQLIIAAVIIIGVVAITVLSLTGRNKHQSQANSNSARTDYAIILDDYSYTPKNFSVGPARTISIALTNTSRNQHSLVFKTLDFSSGLIDPGKTKIVTFTTPAAPGNYDFYCQVPGHQEKGMVGTMVVQ